MKHLLKNLSDLLFMRTKKAKITNYSALGVCAIYLALVAYPNLVFGHEIQYKNFHIHSTQPIGGNIRSILDETEKKLSGSEVYDEAATHHVYLCNNYTLYSFFAPLSRKAFASNLPFLHNIFIAQSDIEKNEAYKNDAEDAYTRQLSALIAHEVTHTLIENKLGLWRYRRLSTWKNEGYCDYVAYGPNDNPEEGKEFLSRNKDSKKPGTAYRKYYFAMNYLMTVQKMSFSNILSADISLDDVLKKVASAQ